MTGCVVTSTYILVKQKAKKIFNDLRYRSQMSNSPMTCVLSKVCISDLNSNEFIVDCCFGNKGEVVTRFTHFKDLLI